MEKSILVTGATGAQGGSVSYHLLKKNEYKVRCLTRNTNSEKALALEKAGAEVVRGDMDDKESLVAAMDGCYGVFGVTNFWEHFGKELQQGKNLVDAVVAAKVPNFIFSTLPGYNKLSKGKYAVPHCDIKAELEDYAKAQKKDSIFIHVAFYYENFFSYFPPQKREDGHYVFGFPQGNTGLAAVSVDDIGGVVNTLLKKRQHYQGKTMSILGDFQEPGKYAAIMSAITGKKVLYNHIPREVFANLGFPGAEELANMFEVQRLYVTQRSLELIQSKTLYPDIRTFEQWAIKNLESINAILD